MTSDKSLLVIAVIAVIVAAIGLLLTWSNIFAFEQILLQPVTDTGTATVTISQEALIRFAHKNLNWGSGYVDPGLTATLDTEAGVTTNFLGTGVNTLSEGFIIENSGTIELLLDIWGDNAPFLDGTTQVYQYKIANCWTGSYTCTGSPDQTLLQPADTAASCIAGDQDTDGTAEGMWAGFVDMPINPASHRFCGNALGDSGMQYTGAEDEIEINIKLQFEDDISVGPHDNTITVQGTAVS